MIKAKIDILKTMKEHDFNSNRIRKEKIFSQATLDRIRKGNLDNMTISTCFKISKIVEMPIEEIFEFVDDTNEKEEIVNP